MGDVEKVKRMVASCIRRFGTTDPFEIADQLGVLYQIGNLKCDGCYMFLKNHRYIFLSSVLNRQELILVMAHELGHACLIENQTVILSGTKRFYLTQNWNEGQIYLQRIF